jgi:hypothetical protein
VKRTLRGSAKAKRIERTFVGPDPSALDAVACADELGALLEMTTVSGANVGTGPAPAALRRLLMRTTLAATTENRPRR